MEHLKDPLKMCWLFVKKNFRCGGIVDAVR